MSLADPAGTPAVILGEPISDTATSFATFLPGTGGAWDNWPGYPGAEGMAAWGQQTHIAVGGETMRLNLIHQTLIGGSVTVGAITAADTVITVKNAWALDVGDTVYLMTTATGGALRETATVTAVSPLPVGTGYGWYGENGTGPTNSGNWTLTLTRTAPVAFAGPVRIYYPSRPGDNSAPLTDDLARFTYGVFYVGRDAGSVAHAAGEEITLAATISQDIPSWFVHRKDLQMHPHVSVRWHRATFNSSDYWEFHGPPWSLPALQARYGNAPAYAPAVPLTFAITATANDTLIFEYVDAMINRLESVAYQASMQAMGSAKVSRISDATGVPIAKTVTAEQWSASRNAYETTANSVATFTTVGAATTTFGPSADGSNLTLKLGGVYVVQFDAQWDLSSPPFGGITPTGWTY
jgi:hypothetical protein